MPFARLCKRLRTALCCTFALVPVITRAQPAAPPAPSADSATYRFTPGDVVSVRLFFNPELNDEMQIRPDGKVSLQLIGEVQLAGRTVSDAAHELETRYSAEVKTPRVTLQVRTFAALKAYVTGEVVRPGAVSLTGGMDLVSAVAEAGGVRQSGKSHTWILVRKGPEGRLLARKIVSSAANLPFERLQPFDLVIVPARVIARVDRFVEEYIRQVLPGNLQGGFEYLYNRTGSAVSVVPF